MLSFTNVVYHYPSQPVFEDLNLEVGKGEFVFLIGKSGSGKSTLLQMVYMNILPQAGYLQVAGYDSKTVKPRMLPHLRRKVGVVFQDFKLLRDRNIYENLSFVLEVTGVSGREIKKRVNNALADVGLIHRRYSKPDELSGGEKQRVAIARAVVNEPQLILADEPTGNLDPETSSEILDIFEKINAKGTAIIFATHNYEIVKRLNHRIIKLENGRAIKAVLKQKE
ncbi:MAG TPA: cell division ATP-binding protein FtsE [Ignavibacteriaceae bacterium]